MPDDFDPLPYKHSITFAKTLDIFPTSAGVGKAGKLRGVNTWEDWHLIPSSRPVISSPSVSSKYIEIPGRNANIDFSEYLCGRPVYGNRTGSFEFYVDNDHEYWETIRSNIINYLHGQKLFISLEDDPRFYWEGRFSMDSWKSEASYSRVVISYNLNPYKTALADAGTERMLWDIFNFEVDYDWDALNSITATSSSQTFNIPVFSFPFAISASLISSGSNDSVYVSLNSDRVHLTNSSRSDVINADASGYATLAINGTGTVRIGFRERSL